MIYALIRTHRVVNAIEKTLDSRRLDRSKCRPEDGRVPCSCFLDWGPPGRCVEWGSRLASVDMMINDQNSTMSMG